MQVREKNSRREAEGWDLGVASAWGSLGVGEGKILLEIGGKI